MTKRKRNTVKRDHKSRMFTMIFSDEKELLELYNAIRKDNRGMYSGRYIEVFFGASQSGGKGYEYI